MSDTNKSFVYNMLTNKEFRLLTRDVSVDEDIRTGEFCLMFDKVNVISIPRELSNDPVAMERYLVDAVHFLLKSNPCSIRACMDYATSKNEPIIAEFRRGKKECDDR